MERMSFDSPRDIERREQMEAALDANAGRSRRFDRISRELSAIFPSKPLTPKESGMSAVMRAVATGHLHGIVWMTRDEDGGTWTITSHNLFTPPAAATFPPSSPVMPPQAHALCTVSVVSPLALPPIQLTLRSLPTCLLSLPAYLPT